MPLRLSRPLRILLLLEGLPEVIQSVESAKLKIDAIDYEASYAEEITPPQVLILSQDCQSARVRQGYNFDGIRLQMKQSC